MSTIKIPAAMFRSAEFGPIDAEARTATLSVSSDQPYQRFFGTEILSHKDGAVRLNRLNRAGALLFNHDRNAHIGRVMSAGVDGQKLNVTVKFGNSPLAKEKFQDIQDGILQEASIGYEIHKMEESKDEKTFTATDWEPHEVSMVTVPADPSVGMGRDLQTKDLEVGTVDKNGNTKAKTNMPEPTVTDPTSNIDVENERRDAVKDFQSRCKKINEFVAAIKNPKWREESQKVAQKHLMGEANFEEFRTEALNAFDPVKHVEIPDNSIGMSKGDRKRFSVRKLILEAFVNNGRITGIEKEACDAAREQLRSAGDSVLDNREGFTLPEDMSRSSMAEDHDLDSRAMDRIMGEFRTLKRGLQASVQNLGGYLIGTDLLTGSLIEYLRVKTTVANMGIRNLDGLVNNVAIPRVTGTGTVYWLAEGATVTASTQAFGQLTLTPHRLGADTFYTKQLLNQASLSVEAFVREDLVAAMAVELDRVYINGAGIAGEPQGIMNTPGVGTITYSATPTLAKLLTQESDIATANADIGALAWLFSPAARAKLKATVAYANTASPLWDAQNMVIGYPATMSNNLPGNKSIYGVWSDFIAARWAGLDVVVDPYSLKKSEQIEVTMHQWVDCGIRHPTAFEISTDSAGQ
jgi:HK97 family phage major capsid protein/HK97 family phage prohead protease